MQKMMACLLFIVAVILNGCAKVTTSPTELTELKFPSTTTIIIPNDQDIDANKFNNMEFSKKWNVSYYNGSVAKQDVIIVKNKTSNTFDLDRRTDNGVSGSGILYTINYSIERKNSNTILSFKPIKYTTYQEGLILSFPTPEFTESDLSSYISSHAVEWKIEINSQYNTESIFANFKRLASEEPFTKGEKDPIAGHIFKNRFSILVNNRKVLFSLETFPYRNGTKSVIYLHVSGYYTSDNTVDFNMILPEIKKKLDSIVNS